MDLLKTFKGWKRKEEDMPLSSSYKTKENSIVSASIKNRMHKEDWGEINIVKAKKNKELPILDEM